MAKQTTKGDAVASNKSAASQIKGKNSSNETNAAEKSKSTASGKVPKASFLRVQLFEKYAAVAKELYSSKEKPTIKAIMDELKKRGCAKPDLVRYFLIGSGASRKNAEGKMEKFSMYEGVPEYRFLTVDIKRLKSEGKEIPFSKSFSSKSTSRFIQKKTEK